MAASRNGQVLENAGLKVNVVKLPKGEDPDSFLRKYEAKELDKLIQESKEFFLYFLDYSTGKYDIKTVNGKASAVQEIIPIIQASNNEIKRRFYIQKLSECIDIPEVAIISEIKKLKKGQSFDTQEIKKSDEKSKFSLLQAEKILINLLLDNSNLIEQTKSFFDLNWTTNEYSKKILNYLFTVDSTKICDIMNLLENFLSEEEFRFLRELILGFEFDNNVDKVWRDCLCCIRNSFIVSKKDYLIKQIKEAKSLNNSDQETKLLIEYYKLGEELANPFLNF
jgi:DNA primase